jgi:predicted nuclease with TOPRIM domain
LLAMMNVSIASPQLTPVASPPEEEPRSALFWCLNPLANRRQAKLEAQVNDLNSKLEEAMKSQNALSEQLLDAMTKNTVLEQEMKTVRAENCDLQSAGVSFRKTVAWKVKNSFTGFKAITAAAAH